VYQSRIFGTTASLAVSFGLLLSSSSAPAQIKAGSASFSTSEALRQFSLSQSGTFIENKGQWDSRVKFLARSDGVDSWVTKDGVVYDFHKSVSGPVHVGHLPAMSSEKRVGDVVRVSFAGAAPATVKPGRELPGKLNYMIGNDRSKWGIGARRFAEAQTGQIYPGVSARYYFDGGMPRYDLVVAPGADPTRILMTFEGAKSVATSRSGTLKIETGIGTVEERGLYAYQGDGFLKRPVACSMVAEGTGVSFRLAKYDRAKALVIDPLIFSSFLGGGLADICTGVAADPSGNVVVGGVTYSSGFPLSTGAYQTTNKEEHGGTTGFVAKLSSNGSSLVVGTYLGGSQVDSLNSMAVDSLGNVIVAGHTYSTDFPVSSGCFQSTNKADVPDYPTAFVAELSSDGTSLNFGTYLGGSTFDYGYAVGVNSSGVYVAGFSGSTDFPVTVGAFQRTNNASSGATGFVARLALDGKSLTWASYLGGTTQDEIHSLVLDSSSNVTVCGNTDSNDFPTSATAYQKTNKAFPDPTGIVSQFSSDGSQLNYSTYLGGSAYDLCLAVALDPSDDPVVVGQTNSVDFPCSAGAFQIFNGTGGEPTGFIAKLSADASALLTGTYLGGNVADYVQSVVIDSSGNIIVGGDTNSHDFPVTAGAYQTSNAGAIQTAFVSELNSTGTSLLYSTYLGIDSDCNAVTLDGSGNTVAVGGVTSSSFPVTSNAYQHSWAFHSSAGFVTDLGLVAAAAVSSFTVNPTAAIGGNPVTATLDLSTAAGSGGTTVTISAGGNVGVTGPASATVLQGNTEVQFSVTTTAVSADTVATLTATFGSSSKTASLTIDAASITGVSVNPTSVVGGTSSTGTVTLNSNAGPTGDSVAITVPSPASAGASAVVPSGGRTKTFTISTSAVSVSTPVTISGTWRSTTKTTTLTVTPAAVTAFTVSPTAIYSGSTSTGTITLASSAGPAGDAVAMTRSAVGATSPVTVTVPSGSTSTTFTLTGSTVASITNVVFTATFDGVSKQATLTVYPPPVLTGFTVSNTGPVMTAGVTGTVTMNEPLLLNLPLTAVDSSDGRIAIDSQPVVLAGHSTGTFPLHAVQISNVSTGMKNIKSSTVTVSYNGVNQQQVMTVSTFGASSPSLSKTTIHAGQSTVLTINAAHFAGVVPLLVNLSTDNTALAAVPATVNIPAGATSTTVTITAPVRVAGTNTVTLTVTISSAPIQTITLTVEP